MKSLKVLVVDDEPGIRSGIERVLRNLSVGYPFMEEDFNYQVIESETGEEALNILNKDDVDIVLLDNQLPGINGIDVLNEIKKNEMSVLVIMITSYASLDLAVKATQNGAYSFVPKPFTPTELKASIENATKHLFLKRMTKEMDSSANEIGYQFLSVLSHELKSPINAVEGYLRIMKDKQVGDQLGSYEKMIDRSIERIKAMRSLIFDLLDVTRLHSSKKKREKVHFHIKELARRAMDSVEPLAKQKNIRMFLDAKDELSVLAVKDEIEIIFNNLFSNAVKYNKENGEVVIFMQSKGNELIIKVSDTGIGMTQDEISLLFQDFVRIKNEKTKDISGSGLGLSIVKKIVETDYKGSTAVESEPEKGSTFTISLPIVD